MTHSTVLLFLIQLVNVQFLNANSNVPWPDCLESENSSEEWCYDPDNKSEAHDQTECIETEFGCYSLGFIILMIILAVLVFILVWFLFTFICCHCCCLSGCCKNIRGKSDFGCCCCFCVYGVDEDETGRLV